MTPLPRRQFIQGSALAAALASMAACSTSSGNDDGPVTFEGTGPITWVQGKDNSGGKVQARIDEWNKAHPGEEVKLIELSAEADQQRTALVNAARINSNAYDVVSLDNVWVSEFAANRWVVELPEDELKNDDILEPVWQTGVYKDKFFAVPFHTDAPVMFYRKDFLAEAGVAVPTTWDEVKTAIDKVRGVKEELEKMRQASEIAERDGDYGKVAELRYGTIPQLEKQLEQLEQQSLAPTMLSEEVTPDTIAEVVSAWTGIPAGKMLEGETEKLLHMEDELGKRVVGQLDAVQAVADAVRRARAGVADPNRPMGSFLFLGPTGVGKTELAKSLAEFMFDDERAMVRIDMSEYAEKHAVARLVGAPPGYVGYDQGGQLTEAVRRRPYTVVLFDEVEKAHPDVFDILLQVLDDGRLTDGQGRTVDFRNTILILTSNLGAGGTPEQMMDAVKKAFKPEFINRLDDVVIFDPLSKDQLTSIVDIQIRDLAERLASRRLTLKVSDDAKEWLADRGYDPAYGARPLRRLIQQAIGDALAKKLLAGEIRDGDTVNVAVNPATDDLTVGK